MILDHPPSKFPVDTYVYTRGMADRLAYLVSSCSKRKICSIYNYGSVVQSPPPPDAAFSPRMVMEQAPCWRPGRGQGGRLAAGGGRVVPGGLTVRTRHSDLWCIYHPWSS